MPIYLILSKKIAMICCNGIGKVHVTRISMKLLIQCLIKDYKYSKRIKTEIKIKIKIIIERVVLQFCNKYKFINMLYMIVNDK